MKRAGFLVPLGVFVGLAVMLAVALNRDPREVPSPLIGKPAPTFALPTLGNPERSIAMADMKGKVWMLNVWASWCVACREEHALLVAFAKRGTVPIYGLNYKDQRNDGLQWLAERGDPYRASLFDADGRVGIDFGVYGVPETFIIDKTGTIRFKHIGPLTPEVLTTEIEPLVKKLDA